MNEILKEVMKHIPENAEISESGFEAANIILYTKNKDFFLNPNSSIKDIVDRVKKRIELRPDPSLLMDEEKAEKEIRKLVPKEAGLTNVIFDEPRSKVILEAEKPGLAIGKSGEILHKIKQLGYAKVFKSAIKRSAKILVPSDFVRNQWINK